MKVCENCSQEIGNRDGYSYCAACDAAESYDELKCIRRRVQRREREEIMRSLGLKRVRGALGGVYWE